MCEPHVEPRGETVTAKSGAARHGAIKRCHVGGAVAIVVTCGGVGPCSARASRRGHLNHCGCIRHGRGRHGTPSSVRTHSHGRRVGRGGPTALASVRDTGRQASFSRQGGGMAVGSGRIRSLCSLVQSRSSGAFMLCYQLFIIYQIWVSCIYIQFCVVLHKVQLI
jgi:hypothetical protein